MIAPIGPESHVTEVSRASEPNTPIFNYALTLGTTAQILPP